MNQTPSRCLAALLPGLVLVYAAAVADDSEDPMELDQLVVTAALEPLARDEVAASLTVITREEIERRQARFLADLLRSVPGFSVSQSGGPGSQTQVRVRGAEANQVLVLVDGVRASDAAASDEFQWQYALTSGIERIEIVRGPQSAIWGSDAVGGVINIIRRPEASGQRLGARVEAGSFDTVDLAADAAWAAGGVQFSGSVAHFDSDGTNIARRGFERDGSDNTTAALGAEYRFGAALTGRLSGQWVDAANDFDTIDFLGDGLPADADLETQARQAYWRGELRLDPAGSPWSGELSLNYTDTDNRNFSAGLPGNRTAAETLEARLRASYRWTGGGENRLSLALDRRDSDFRQRGPASPFGDPNQDQSYAVTGVAAEYAGQPYAGFHWTVSGRRDDYSAFEDATTWRIAASHRLDEHLRLRASWGTASKAPTFTERFGFFEDFFIGNPDLEPESSRGWEVGLDGRWRDGDLALGLAWFDQRLEDEIDGFVFDPARGGFTALNRATPSHRQGVELTAAARLAEHLGVSASYTYTDATETGPGGQRLREVRRPRQLAGLALDWDFVPGRGILHVNVDYSGERLDLFFDPGSFTSERVVLEARTLVDLAASWRLGGTLELTGRVANLTDEEYEEVLGFTRPGRAWYAGLRGRFGAAR